MIILSACVIGSLFLLILTIQISKPLEAKNGFNRHFLGHKLEPSKSIHLNLTQFYFAGNTKYNIYLGNYLNSGLLFSSDYSLQDTQYHIITCADKSPIAWRMLNVQIDSPWVYLMEGLTPALLATDFAFKKCFRMKVRRNNFSASMMLSPGIAVVRSFDKSLGQDILSVERSECPNDIPLNHFILEKQMDGRFSVDGMFIHLSNSDRFIYLYYYRNSFYMLDSNIQQVYKGQTIDTNRYAKLKIGRIEREDKTTLLTPPPTVNQEACANERYLLVYSGLRADNETSSIFSPHAIIDIYSLLNGQYVGSIYLETVSHKKIASMAIFHQHLMIIQDDLLSDYFFPL